jgi:hypothetical protein
VVAGRSGSIRAGPISGIRYRATRHAAAIWLGLAVVYMDFAGPVSVHEGVAAVLCATLGKA